jgi:hypothetical protein
MTSVDEILGICVVRVQFDRGETTKIPIKCYSCHGNRYAAINRDCEDYKPYCPGRGLTEQHLFPSPGHVQKSKGGAK